MAVFTAMGPYRHLGEKAFAKHGIWAIDSEQWYAIDILLGVLDVVAEHAGANTLFAIGKRVPEHAAKAQALLPPPDVDTALRNVDVYYHRNHRKDGKVMYDPATGTMLEGIGHYHAHADGPRRFVIVCDNPYPAEFDHGLLTAFARSLSLDALVERDETKPNRARGGDSCTFVVTL
jgi:hypothetical protein